MSAPKTPLGSPREDRKAVTCPVRFAAREFPRKPAAIAGWIALILVIALWQLAGSAGWVNPLFLPAPSAIALAIYKLAMSGALWHHVSVSVMRIVNGMDSRHDHRRHRRLRDRAFEFSARHRHHFHLGAVSDSEIALLPLLILWLGIGEEPKIATIALGVFFSTAISVYSGVDAVPRNLIRMAQSFNVPFETIVRRVIWPGALPSILAGFRITALIALLLVVSAEMIGAEFGIGAFVLQAGNLMQTDQLLAGVVILSLFGLAVGRLINLLETRLLHWR